MKMTITSYGDKQVSRDLMRMGRAPLEASPAMEAIVDKIMLPAVEQTFFSQGRRGGGSWRRLTLPWLERKRREGLDTRILFATGRLFESLTNRGDPDMHLEIKNTSIEYGSELPYAERHQKGDAHIPQRRYIRFTEFDKRKMAKELQAHIIRRFRPAARRAT